MLYYHKQIRRRFIPNVTVRRFDSPATKCIEIKHTHVQMASLACEVLSLFICINFVLLIDLLSESRERERERDGDEASFCLSISCSCFFGEFEFVDFDQRAPCKRSCHSLSLSLEFNCRLISEISISNFLHVIIF